MDLKINKPKTIAIAFLVIVVLGKIYNVVFPKVFISEEIGWTIEIPKYWSVKSESEAAKDVAEGQELLQQNGTNLGIVPGTKPLVLINHNENEINKLQAGLIPFDMSNGFNREAYIQMIREELTLNYRKLGFWASSTLDTAEIDGVAFEVIRFKVRIKGSTTGMDHVMYRHLIESEGYEFVVNITSEKSYYEKKIMEKWNESKFSHAMKTFLTSS